MADMPYRVEKEGDQWCVYKKGSDKKIGEFGSRMEAMQEVRRMLKSPPPAEKESKAEDNAKDNEDEEDY